MPPVVGLVHVGHRRGDSAFGHHRVRLAEQRFANHADLRALRQRLDRGAKARAARADDQHIVFVGFVFGVSSQQSNVLDRAGRNQPHIQIGQAHGNQAHPCPEHVAFVRAC